MEAKIEDLKHKSQLAKAYILTMTTLAKSGHPGGSMSSIDLLLTLYDYINIDHTDINNQQRDRVIVSHGHISPAVYTTLALSGFFDIEDVVVQFRLAGSRYEGHIEPEVPGIEWATGNLGQGLSAATGFALESRIRQIPNRVYCLMGDGEQQKGQISEARRFAVKYKLNNITAIVDFNQLQICGEINQVMPQNIRENYESDGWTVLEIDGHDIAAILATLKKAELIETPVLILAHTTMGMGVSFMENKEKYHGSPLPETDLIKAYCELEIELPYDDFKQKRINLRKSRVLPYKQATRPVFKFSFMTNPNFVYEKPTDNRSAWGDAITDIANLNKSATTPLVVFDCDLQGSVKTAGFEKLLPDWFFQSGIMEHHTVVCAGALSKNHIQTFFANFAVFGIDETYNQHRLNDINHTNLKVILTHAGLDVGEDGKTHQCIDYIGLANNLFGYKLIIPADPNQTYKVINFLANTEGNYIVLMGRSQVDIIRDSYNESFFDADYRYIYGKADILREGESATIFVCGGLTQTALRVVDELKIIGYGIRLVNISSPLSIENELISEAVRTGLIFTLEDHNVKTGLGSIISQRVADNGFACRIVRMGVDKYAFSGAAEDVYASFGLDYESVINRTLSELEKHHEEQ
jgi:transketolase